MKTKDNIEISDSAIKLIKENKFKIEFQNTLDFFTSKINRYEKLSICEWYKPFIYIEVHDSRWKHYPCYCRALVSFDISNGKVADMESENRYQFARKGWRSAISKLIGYDCTKYNDCGNPKLTTYC